MSADEMFEELGYFKEEIVNTEYIQEDNLDICIKFWRNDKTFSKIDDNGIKEWITMEELKAINKKCEELGWI